MNQRREAEAFFRIFQGKFIRTPQIVPLERDSWLTLKHIECRLFKTPTETYCSPFSSYLRRWGLTSYENLL